MGEHFPIMVPGAKAGTNNLTVTAPYDLTEIATVETTDGAAAEIALSTAYGLFRNRDKWLSMPERIAIFDRAIEIMHSQRETLAVETAREGGKPLVDSLVEIDRAIDSLKICIETARTEGGYAVPMGVTASSSNRIAVTRKEPIGVVVAVSAFNHPMNLIAHQVAPAIISGCPVIVKPANATPLACLRFTSIMREAGLPEEWCQVTVTDNRQTAEQLVTDPRTAFFSFIGSPGVGWSLRSKLAPGTRCALEHGGAAPAIIASDANMEATLASVLKGGFYHAGQVCVSVQRVFAEASIAEAFANALADDADNLNVGDPTVEATEVGPLINPKEVDRVHEWVEEAKAGGGQILCGGEKLSDTCYKPTVILNPPADCTISRKEVFGPVVCVYSYSDMDSAIEQANSLPFAFQAAVFTQDMDQAMRAYAKLDASAVMINDHTAFRVDWMPFAGLRQSGHGVGGIPHTMHEMQIDKMMVIKSPEL